MTSLFHLLINWFICIVKSIRHMSVARKLLCILVLDFSNLCLDHIYIYSAYMINYSDCYAPWTISRNFTMDFSYVKNLYLNDVIVWTWIQMFHKMIWKNLVESTCYIRDLSRFNESFKRQIINEYIYHLLFLQDFLE